MLKSSLTTVSIAAFVSAVALGSTPMPAAAGAAGGLISEIRVGVLDHDAGRDSPSKTIEGDTVDINGEILSVPLIISSSSIPALNALYQPRVHLGFTANTEGWTHTAYTGLTWDWNLGAGFFTDFAFGFTGQTGQLKGKKDSKGAFITDGRPNLGSPILFREALEIGYHVDAVNSVSVYAAHMSNAGWLAKENDGMNFLGMRYGYRFN